MDGQGGADTYVVNDLYATEVVSINLLLGPAGAVNPVTLAAAGTVREHTAGAAFLAARLFAVERPAHCLTHF